LAQTFPLGVVHYRHKLLSNDVTLKTAVLFLVICFFHAGQEELFGVFRASKRMACQIVAD
jgi:hypothetical protein